ACGLGSGDSLPWLLRRLCSQPKQRRIAQSEKEGLIRVKLLKLLSIPVAIVIAGLFATPALANHAMIDVAQNCQKAGQVCMDLTISTAEIPQGQTRDIKVTI